MPLLNKSTLAIEITTTQKCNMKCSYCFEGEELQNNKAIIDDHQMVDKIKELYNSSHFKILYDKIKICFWGGEPTLNYKTCNLFITEFADMNAEFFFYTNGYSFIHAKNIMDNYINVIGDDFSRISMQISYDGIYNDLERVDHNGNGTSEKIFLYLEMMNKHYPTFLNLSLKSTLLPEQLKNMVDNWKHFEEIHNRFPQFDFKWSPTIEYTNIYKISSNDLKEIRSQFLKIAKLEYDRFFNNKSFLLNWFNIDNHSIICSAGTNIINIDLEGNLTPCHGALYSKNKDKLIITNIFNNDFIESFFIKAREYKVNLLDVGYVKKQECNDCSATVCYQCPTNNFDHNQTDDFYDSFYSQKYDLCSIYDTFGKISRSLKNKLK